MMKTKYMAKNARWMAAAFTLAAAIPLASLCQAGKVDRSIDLLSCVSSTDERLGECGVYGFSIADPDRLAARIDSLKDVPFSRHDPGFLSYLKNFPKLVYRGIKHFIVPRARAFLGMKQEDLSFDPEVDSQAAFHRRSSRQVKLASLSLQSFEIDPEWAFERADMGVLDAGSRAWQRGHDHSNPNVSLEPALKANQYGMSLEVRF